MSTTEDPGLWFRVPDADEGERRSLRRWQSTDRFYRAVQQAMRTGNGTVEAERVASDLAALIERSCVLHRVMVWRGNRSAANAFGVPTGELQSLVGREWRIEGFAAASLSRRVAEAEFTEPPGEGGRSLSRLTIAAGTPALWVPAIGDPTFGYQQEVLMLNPVVRWAYVDRRGPIPIVAGEVI